ncbi:DUF961 family protein [Enterococcus faecium]|uniref:DUF961 domain-containing protein n=1 Tax=Enterococcus faecium EnGen0003 TaxID=1138901 RepID=A0A828ZRV7_ENTFC|nr:MULTISPECIES: DUF961 family protein [Enterococcus]EEV50104.1 predicted protein [Enterococcus faecium 1,141,733]EGP4724038.1 DUF961 domain-containing protein [Enterococcus faecium]EGP4958265.1 DUF961 domain-containing protein [Enterococcus faecium]EGP5083728.1 DUF961 domain-containing protein [Enterococcus faecium]EGP5132654.1 DUF961 domain-containing protein [Enterococcus faecium]
MEFAIAEPKETFGKLEYVGRKDEYAEYVNGNRKVVGHYHALLSVKQQETIEVILPNRGNSSALKLNYGDEVELKEVRCEPFSQVAGDTGAVSGWTIKVKEIVKVK